MTLTQGQPQSRVSYAESVVWIVVVFLAGILPPPGLGLGLGMVLAFTRLRHNNPAARIVVVVLGVLLLIGQLGVMSGTSGGFGDSPARPAGIP